MTRRPTHATPAILERMRAMGDPASVKGRARFGLPEEGALGVSLPKLRRLAKELGRDTPLAKELWATGIPEARLLATLVADPRDTTRAQVERWVKDVSSWDVCDGLALNLVDKTEWAWEAAPDWARRKDEWGKRLGLATMAGLAWHRKDEPDPRFSPYFAVCELAAMDERNYVKKAASWALRQMGKRSPGLRKKALASAARLAKLDAKSARWVAKDVTSELTRVTE